MSDSDRPDDRDDRDDREHAREADLLLARCDRLAARVRELEAEVANAYETTKRLNRRAQFAEKALADLLRCNEVLASGKAWCGGSLGRAFLAWGYARQKEQLAGLGAENARLRGLVEGLTGRVRELEECLRPFAAVEALIPGTWPGFVALNWEEEFDRRGQLYACIRYLHADCRGIAPLIDDYRRAATALADKEPTR